MRACVCHEKDCSVAAVFVFILLLTKIANQTPPDPPSGYTFWMYAQHVVECTPGDITLVDVHQTETHFEKDQELAGLLGVSKKRCAGLPFVARRENEIPERRKDSVVAKGNVKKPGNRE